MTTWRRKIAEYEADLYVVQEQEPTFLNRLFGSLFRAKRGEMEMKGYDDGEKILEIEFFGVRVPDGSSVSAVVDGASVCEVPVRRGRARLLLSTNQGDPVPDVQNGSVAEIHYTGQALLEGTFRPD